MENIVTVVIPLLLSVLVLKLLLKPLQLGLKLAIHSAAGISCLTLLNAVSGISGVYIPINAVTTLVSAALGLPGIALLGLLEMVP